MIEIHTREEAETMLATAAKKYEDKIYRKGRQEGREEGREETRVGTVLRAHAAGLNRTQIARITGMQAEEIDTILAQEGNSVKEKRARYRPSGKRKKR
jgi:predicted transposase YdaD